MIVEVTSLEQLSKSEITTLGELFAKETGLGSFDYDHFCNRVNVPLNMGLAKLFCMKKTADSPICGILGGLITDGFLTTDLTALEMFWYVHPDHRGSLEAIKLLNAYELWAMECGAKSIFMGFIQDINPESLTEFYKRRGYKPFEQGYIKRL